MKPIFTLKGKVKKGNKRGKRLGFPTINFKVDASLEEGIYISQILIDQKLYNSLTFIGAAKTYDEQLFQAETYIFDFTKDIYGESVTVFILKKLRDNQKFTSEEELIAQMEKDRKEALRFFSSLS